MMRGLPKSTWVQHLSTLPHYRTRDSVSSSGFATHLVGACEVTRVRGVQKTPEEARMALAMGRKSRNRLYAARPPAGSGGDLKWQVWQDFGIPKSRLSSLKSGGREGIRTPGLLVANEALSQLSYSPTSSESILANVEREAKRVCGLGLFSTDEIPRGRRPRPERPRQFGRIVVPSSSRGASTYSIPREL